jgi:hypothetical protein
MKDSRYKEIMNSLGMPNSRSLLLALEQVANEVAQEQKPKKPNLNVYATLFQRTSASDWEKGVRVECNKGKDTDHIIDQKGHIVPEVWDLHDAFDEGCFVLQP